MDDILNKFYGACVYGNIEEAKRFYGAYRLTTQHLRCMEMIEDVCYNGHTHIIVWLVSLGLGVNDIKASKSLHNACTNGHSKLVDYLVSIGFDTEDFTEEIKNTLLQKGYKRILESL